MALTAVSLFTGCGGSDTGMLRAGFSIIMANDIFSYGRDCYLANLPETDYQLNDISTIKSFPLVDVLFGCYPCQGFSQGGARRSEVPINYLYKQFYRALLDIQPKAFVIENVSGLVRSDSHTLFMDQLKCFESAGYHVKFKKLCAMDYGIAQERYRVFIVGLKRSIGDYFQFPEKTHSNEDEKLPNYKTIKEALKGMTDWPSAQEYYDLPFHWYYMSRNRYRGWNEISKTIVANARHIPLHPASPEMVKVGVDEWRFVTDQPARRFSYREASRLQGFSKEYIFPENGNLMNKYKAIGNAVPPVFFEHIGNELKSYI